MSGPSPRSPARTVRSKKPVVHSTPSALSSPSPAPKTFFLCHEKEAGRQSLEDSQMPPVKERGDGDTAGKGEMPAELMARDDSFGVESLAATIDLAPSRDGTLRRTSDSVPETPESFADSGRPGRRKRKSGNPVHPKIHATGQRIIGSETSIGQSSGAASPVSLRSLDSPVRAHLRRPSVASPSRGGPPLTPLEASPQSHPAVLNTPRSGSPKSFKLSDEDASVASDTNHSTAQSMTREENASGPIASATTSSVPLLVMPSLSMPTRRPFTERGKRMGPLKLMVVGNRGAGKSRLLHSMCRVCEDIVHHDPVHHVVGPTVVVEEASASTKPHRPWLAGKVSKESTSRNEMAGGALERNLTFVDTPGFVSNDNTGHVREYFDQNLMKMMDIRLMQDSDVVSMLGGAGGPQIDVVLWLFDATSSDFELPPEQADLLRQLERWTSVIPLISHADEIEPHKLLTRKQDLLASLRQVGIHESLDVMFDGTKTFEETSEVPMRPYAVSSALMDDSETIDASVLMSSTYLEPLVPSELGLFIDQLLEPDNIARLRHLSATKFLLWRQDRGSQIDIAKQAVLTSRGISLSCSGATSSGSAWDDPNGILVPHSSSGYHSGRSPYAPYSPGLFNAAGISRSCHQSLYSEVHVEEWAQTLQRAINDQRERMHYTDLHADGPCTGIEVHSTESERYPTDRALVPRSQLPPKGRLGGALGVVDPRDPLGILLLGQRFGRQGRFAVQLFGCCGVLGATVWWVVKNWAEFQAFFGLNPGEQAPLSVTAVPAPSDRSWVDQAFRRIYG